MFFEFSQINHIRENNENKIDDIELYEIMKNVETIALKKHFKSIKELS
ncbi:MAG: hypothetical protein Q8S84_08760 [bacterium]|nr:hypothetical protein [bacterium]MDP3381519.1 hypothetical protein [bacterium]